jgi:hypothetical protein
VSKKNFIWFAGALSILFLTASWKHERMASYGHTASFVQELRGVQITAKKYVPNESRTFLAHDLYSLGYVPVELTIQNNTSNSYALSAASVPLACEKGKSVAWSVTKKSMPRSIGLKIAALFFWPLLIPDTMHSIHTYRSHQALSQDLTAKTLKEKDEVVLPYTSVKRVLYVKEEAFQENFSVALQEIGGDDELLVIPTTTTTAVG